MSTPALHHYSKVMFYISLRSHRLPFTSPLSCGSPNLATGISQGRCWLLSLLLNQGWTLPAARDGWDEDPGQRSDSAGDLAGDMEPLTVAAPAGAEEAAASAAEVEGGDKAAARGEVESPKGAGPGGTGPQGAAAVVAETWEYPEAKVGAACARAAERIAVSQAAKVLQSAIAELKEKRSSTWLKPKNTTQQQEEDWVEEGKVK
ncbi:uncharacterized protein LOC136018345 [Lathamus discolor]|uniref:uncharacterized protein LOC136018345 n=1 Tax=Lathamus discolor TaxID=678569 RepID=UPI0032B702CA